MTIFNVFAWLLKAILTDKAQLAAENIALRQQIAVLRAPYQTAQAPEIGSPVLGLPICNVERMALCPSNRQTRNRD